MIKCEYVANGGPPSLILIVILLWHVMSEYVAQKVKRSAFFYYRVLDPPNKPNQT
jgi:hypothetical protein